MKRFLLCFVAAVILTSLNANAANNFTLWVGESISLDFSPMGSWYNVRWSSDVSYVEINGGSNFTKKAKVAQYFKGTAIVSVSWDEQLYYNGPITHRHKEWYITCRDNPISLYQGNQLSISIGETAQLNYKLKYDNQYSSNAKPYFYSSNSDIVSCTKQGLITAVSEGSAYVYVYSYISAEKASCKVIVTGVKPTGISIPATLILKLGEEKQLEPTITPSNAKTNLKWYSSNPTAVTVSDDGIIKAIRVGDSKISVITDNNIKAECDVKVIIEPDSMMIQGYNNSTEKSFELFVKDSIDARIVLLPAEAIQTTTITANSKDESIATAERPYEDIRNFFYIYGHKEGTTIIEFKTDNGLSVSSKVIIKGYTTSAEDGIKIRKFHNSEPQRIKTIENYLK